MLNHTEILGVKDKGSPLILIHRHILARTRLFHNRIFPPARMGAGALIRVSSGKIIAQKTPAGIGNAHGAMDKAFDLHLLWYMFPDLPDLS